MPHCGSRYFRRSFGSPRDGRRQGELSGTDCHSIHGKHGDPSITPYLTTRRKLEYETCGECHKSVRAQLNKNSHHPILEGKVACSDCHNPHGALSHAMVKNESVNQLCAGCHADKRGPFVWSHLPVEENCLSCHNSHGSNVPKLLNVKVPQLCQDCHGSGHGQLAYGSSCAEEDTMDILKTKTSAVLPVLLVLLAVPLQAADGGFTLTGSITLGGQFVNTKDTVDEGKMREYRDLTSGVLSGFELTGRSSDTFIDLYGENIARKDMYLNLEGGKYKAFKYRLFSDSMQHFFTTDARTPYSGAGTANQTAVLPSLNPDTWNVYDLAYKRRSDGAMFELSLDSPWYVRADLGQVGSSRVDLQACKLEYSIVSPK